MGYEFSVYVGPYIEIPEVEITVAKKGYRCTGCRKPYSKAVNFCSDCGKDVSFQEYPVKTISSPHPANYGDRWGELVSLVEVNKRHFWIPNTQGYGNRFNEDYEVVVTPIASLNLELNAQRFASKIEELLLEFHKQHGIKLAIEVGVVPYYS